jgi:hypothetical protein
VAQASKGVRLPFQFSGDDSRDRLQAERNLQSPTPIESKADGTVSPCVFDGTVSPCVVPEADGTVSPCVCPVSLPHLVKTSSRSRFAKSTETR